MLESALLQGNRWTTSLTSPTSTALRGLTQLWVILITKACRKKSVFSCRTERNPLLGVFVVYLFRSLNGHKCCEDSQGIYRYGSRPKQKRPKSCMQQEDQPQSQPLTRCLKINLSDPTRICKEGDEQSSIVCTGIISRVPMGVLVTIG
jgi:hypothetical protein